MNPIEIPSIPKQGDIWFYINLNLVQPHLVPGLFVLLVTLGFQPQLAYRRVRDEIEICLFLYHGFIEGLVEPPHQLYAREQQILAEVLEDPSAMHFLCGLNRKLQAISA